MKTGVGSSFFKDLVACCVDKKAKDLFWLNKKLERIFQKKLKVTQENCKTVEYHTVLEKLTELARDGQYFHFAATQLLNLSANEVHLGIYHGDYCALHYLESLFYNAGANTTVSLKARIDTLTALLDQSKQTNNYAQLYMLVKTLAVAANPFEIGEHDAQDDPDFIRYIHFSIENIMSFTGLNDEDGLCCTAEEEIHALLEQTIDCPEIYGATSIPYQVFRHYLSQSGHWNCCPTYKIQCLEDSIQELQGESNAEERLALLKEHLTNITRILLGREYVASTFDLVYSSKSERKQCLVGADHSGQTQLDLHTRQSLAERLIYAQTTNIHEIARGWPKCTLVVANFGLVVTDRTHMKGGAHRRKFKSMPIFLSDITVTGRSNGYSGHAEEALYEYLLKDETIERLLKKFKKQFSIKSAPHKIYSVIFDWHGTYDMCLSCSKKGLEFQNQFREKLLQHFKHNHFITLRKYPENLPIIIRYSADFHYHYSNSNSESKQGLLSLLSNKLEHQLTTPEDEAIDIKTLGINPLLHGGSSWHGLWSHSKIKGVANKTLPIESWTAFSSDNHYRNMSAADKKRSYTLLGEVETEEPNALIESMKKLSIGSNSNK